MHLSQVLHLFCYLTFSPFGPPSEVSRAALPGRLGPGCTVELPNGGLRLRAGVGLRQCLASEISTLIFSKSREYGCLHGVAKTGWLPSMKPHDGEPADTASRRPLKSRSTAWAAALAGFLTRARVPPNAISAASVVFAMLGAAAMAGFSVCLSLPQWLLFLVGAAGIQLRLLCNLMDGMVAVEGNRKSPTGELWNEIPDRFADVLLLVGAGFAAGSPLLGAVAGLGALLTAYLRAFSASLTRRQDFCGPMAKPHRMAALTAACLLSAVAPSWAPPSLIIAVALWIILAGVAVTSVRRISHLSHSLRAGA